MSTLSPIGREPRHVDAAGRRWFLRTDVAHVEWVYDLAPDGHVWRRLSPMSATCVFCGVIAQTCQTRLCGMRPPA